MPMDRRQLFGAAAATVAAASALRHEASFAATEAQRVDAAGKLAALTPRGVDGRLIRLPTLDLESLQDFTLGFRLMQAKQLREASYAAFDRVLEKEGLDPLTEITVEQCRELIQKDPVINIASKTWLANQQVTWKTLQDFYHANPDRYLAELEAGDRSGPGKLTLWPDQNAVPRYTRHEIHIQPGGYTGDPFAGYVYHYGTNSFYISVMGHNEQDQIHKRVAGLVPLPPDGKVRRILDMGCGIGQYTTALKERFPDAEVWGVEIGAPMVRYAHMRSNRLGIGANFMQGLAEDTKFPDGYFDIVVSYILHHELPADITLKVIEEARRVARPGGVYYPLDFKTGGAKMPARMMYGRWWDHRWNNEVWSLEYHSVDFSGEIARRGFKRGSDLALVPAFGARHFVKA
ncbi:MAG: class I SAM-dependent methyltransferase [Steroidobacteraceae bacterium]